MSLSEYGTPSDPFSSLLKEAKQEQKNIQFPTTKPAQFVEGDPRWDADARNGDPYAGPPRFGVDRLGQMHRLKYWEPDTFDVSHELVARLSVTTKNKDIAKAMGMAESTISRIVCDPRARCIREMGLEEVTQSMDDVQNRLQLLSSQAVAVLEEQVRSPTVKDELKQRAAFGILDRAGYGKVERHVHSSVSITPEMAERMEKSLDESDELQRLSYEVE